MASSYYWEGFLTFKFEVGAWFDLIKSGVKLGDEDFESKDALYAWKAEEGDEIYSPFKFPESCAVSLF